MIRLFAFFAALTFTSMAAAEDLYKCQTADGDITYSNEPCPKTDKTVKKIAPGETGNFTVVPAEKASQPATGGRTANAENKKCSAYGAEIRDIDLRLAHGFVAGEEEQLKARRKTLTDAAYKECFSEQK